MLKKCTADTRIVEIIEQCRRKYRPQRVEVLFIAKAPKPQNKNIKNQKQLDFYYNPEKSNNLQEKLKYNLINAGFTEFENTTDKEFLEVFKDRGFYLTDAIKCPVPLDTGTKRSITLLKGGYRDLLIREINELEPRFILTLGRTALIAIRRNEEMVHVSYYHGKLLRRVEWHPRLPKSIKAIIVSRFPNSKIDIVSSLKKLREFLLKSKNL